MVDLASFTGWRLSYFYLRGNIAGEVRLFRGYVRPFGSWWRHRDFTTTTAARAWVESEARLLEIGGLA